MFIKVFFKLLCDIWIIWKFSLGFPELSWISLLWLPPTSSKLETANLRVCLSKKKKTSKHHLTHKAEDRNVPLHPIWRIPHGGCITYQQLEFSPQVSNVLGKMLSEKTNANPSTYHSNPEKLQRWAFCVLWLAFYGSEWNSANTACAQQCPVIQ